MNKQQTSIDIGNVIISWKAILPKGTSERSVNKYLKKTVCVACVDDYFNKLIHA